MRRLSESSRNGLPAQDSFREMRKQILEPLTRKSLPPAGIANAIEAERRRYQPGNPIFIGRR